MSQVPEIIEVGAPALNPSSEDRNPSSAAYPSPAEKKAIVKNADMNDHMQAEAVEIAIYVCNPFLSFPLHSNLSRFALIVFIFIFTVHYVKQALITLLAYIYIYV